VMKNQCLLYQSLTPDYLIRSFMIPCPLSQAWERGTGRGQSEVKLHAMKQGFAELLISINTGDLQVIPGIWGSEEFDYPQHREWRLFLPHPHTLSIKNGEGCLITSYCRHQESLKIPGVLFKYSCGIQKVIRACSRILKPEFGNSVPTQTEFRDSNN